MSLSPGSRLGPYEIVALLGVGGMGEVYRARDAKLGRDVAIKILPQTFAADPDRLGRFEREARTLAALNHPNIAQIYGVEGSALVMELIEGEDLSHRIARGAIPLDEALPIARQIAEALEAAHEHGIIHRDLKPANIRVRADGTVKVLDFGLAKALAPEPGSAAPVDLAQSPTITSPAMITGVGMILGTAAYMSPEQAKGQEVDRTSDVWAFGSLFFELLTGRPAFTGCSVSEVVSEVLKGEADWSQLPADTPSAVHRLLRRCLRKDRRARLQHIGDARLEIEEAVIELQAGPRPLAFIPVRGASRSWLPWAVVALLLATTLGAFLFAVTELRGSGAAPLPVTRLDLVLPPNIEMPRVSSPTASISPDGTRVVFVGTEEGVRRLYVRRFDQDEPSVFKGTDTGAQPFWAPDGKTLGFVKSDRTLQKVSIVDGLVTPVVTGVDRSLGAAWGPDDRIAFVREGALWQIPPGGGQPTKLTTLDTAKKERAHAWPAFAENGKGVLFTVLSDDGQDRARIDVVSVATGERRTVIEPGMYPLHSASGQLVYFHDGSLLAVPFDAERLVAAGRPARVLDDVGRDNIGAPLVALSASGALVYASNRAVNSRLLWVNRQGIAAAITDAERPYESPRLSPGGERLVVNLPGDLFVLDTSRGTFERLSTGATVGGSYGAWTRDSSRVAFRTATGLRVRNADGSGGVEAIAHTSAADFPVSLSKDGDTLAFLRQTTDRSSDVYVLSLTGDRQPRAVVSTPAFESAPYFSPDGRWMAYVSDESGQFEVYVRPYPGPDRKVLVSRDGGVQPVWSGNGKELFYRSGTKMFAVDVTTTPDLKLSTPRVLFDRRYAFGAPTMANYDVTSDGQRFVMIEEDAGARRLSVILNWAEELRRLVTVE